MKQILLTAATVTLLMTGCAQKKISTISTGTDVPTGGATVTQGNGYENVDPYGNGSGQYGNGDYNIDGQYANSGIQNVYFDTDQYNITSDKVGIIAHNAKLLKNHRVKIEGHCDATGTDEYNYALGLRRAKAAKDALENNGINPTQVTLVSMGESSPACTTSSSAECYAKNRRVEFKVIQ